MKDKTERVVITAALVLAVVGIVAFPFLRKKPTVPEPAPAPSVSASAAVRDVGDAEPPISKEPERSNGKDGVLMAAPEPEYTNGGYCLRFAVSPDGGWSLPYPGHLTIRGAGETQDEVDCGFFPRVHASGWRTAFCLNNGKREARRLYLRVLEGKLAVQIDHKKMERTVRVLTGFYPGKCQ